jgi:AcrR family transcriptional regulator
MPAAAKTTDEAIVEAARDAIERSGDAFSMATVAGVVGVKPASLYKRFRDRDALASRVRADAYRRLGAAVVGAGDGRTGLARLHAMAHAYLAYARAHPLLYRFLFEPDDDPAVHEARVASVAPLLAALHPLAGADALNAARTLTAFLHGYVTMSLGGSFQLGGDPDAALTYGLDLILGALAEGSSETEPV